MTVDELCAVGCLVSIAVCDSSGTLDGWMKTIQLHINSVVHMHWNSY